MIFREHIEMERRAAGMRALRVPPPTGSISPRQALDVRELPEANPAVPTAPISSISARVMGYTDPEQIVAEALLRVVAMAARMDGHRDPVECARWAGNFLLDLAGEGRAMQRQAVQTLLEHWHEATAAKAEKPDAKDVG